MEDTRYFWHTQWIFKWLLLPKEVQLKEWELTILSPLQSGFAFKRKFTGVICRIPPCRWVWIRFLSILLNSKIEFVRVFAASKYKKIRAKYEYPSGLVGTSVYSIMPN